MQLLRTAHAWRALLDAGQAVNQAEIARREGITRTRVTQIMGLLRRTREIADPRRIREPASSGVR